MHRKEEDTKEFYISHGFRYPLDSWKVYSTPNGRYLQCPQKEYIYI